jgi:acyl carrier protein
MEYTEVAERVKSVIITVAGYDVNEDEFEEYLTNEMDSFDSVEILTGLEDEFNIQILDEDWSDTFQDKPLTVDNIVEFIKSKLS